MKLGDKIRLRRTELNLTQSGLAKKINADQTQISSYERGDSIPSTTLIIKLAKALKVTTDFLLFDENVDKSISPKIKDTELMKLIEKIDVIKDEEDKKALKKIIEITIIKNSMQNSASSKIL